jgi:hypothetical protein
MKEAEEKMEASRLSQKSDKERKRKELVGDLEDNTTEKSALLGKPESAGAAMPPGAVPTDGGAVEMTVVQIEDPAKATPATPVVTGTEVAGEEDQYSVVHMMNFVTSSIEGKVVYQLMADVGSIYDDLKYFANLALGFGLMGMFCDVAQRELEYWYGDTASLAVLALRGLTTITTFACIYAVYQYYASEVRMEKLTTPYLEELTYWKPDRCESFAWEVLFLLVHNPPGMSCWGNREPLRMDVLLTGCQFIVTLRTYAR